MAVLYANQLSIAFGERQLLNDITFQIGEKDKIGLVGRNGAGKTTLLNLLAGELQPDKGHINRPNSYKVGYLAQELENTSELTVLEEARTAFNELLKIKADIEEINNELEAVTDFNSKQYSNLLQDLTHLHDRLDLMNAHRTDKEAVTVLKGLGFTTQDLSKPAAEFSGGWRMRIELAKLILQEPDLLLLDEPTNHLDIESIIWLEQYLENAPCAIVLVSHDKSFLDKMTNRTFEIVRGKFYEYKVSYIPYLELRELRKEQLMSEKKNQEKFVEHTEKLINKFRAKKNKAAFAQTLVRKLDKLERVELEEEDTRRAVIRFPEALRSGLSVVKIEGLSKSFGENKVLQDISFELQRGEKVAFVGKNGEGKTTLSRIIAGEESHEGICTLGSNVTAAFYSQHTAAMLDLSLSVFDTIDQAATGEMRSKVRSLLGAFLFSGDDVDKPVRVLSGGEKARLALAKMLLQPANLLILDEPTNHLDIVAKDILKHAIQTFSGTVIVVSHDRDFLTGLTTKTYEFTRRSLKEHLGDVNEFLEKRRLREIDDAYQPADVKEGEQRSRGTKRKNNHTRKKELQKQQRKLSKQVAQLEKSIANLEAELAEKEESLKDPVKFKELSNDEQFFKNYEAKQEELALQLSTWENTANALNEAENALSKLESV